jgi:hypothetical protein
LAIVSGGHVVSVIRGIWDLYRSSDRIPKSRRIPSRYETVSMDGWEYGEVALVSVGSFEPTENAWSILRQTLPMEEVAKTYTEIPVWLSPKDANSRVDVMSGKDQIGTVAADPIYLPNLLRVSSKRDDLVADGTIHVKSDGEAVVFKKLKVHVYTSLTRPTSSKNR